MTHILKAVLLTAAFGLAACTSPSQFGDNTVDLNDTPTATIENPAASSNTPAYFTQTIGDRVLFAVDQHTLSPEARQILAGQASWLIDNRDFNALVEGHADEQGTREYNLALSARRASAVQQFLISEGVSPARIKTVPYGKERPIEICSQEACYAKNRRAVTVLNAAGTS